MHRHTGKSGLIIALIGILLTAIPPGADADCPSTRLTSLADLRSGGVAVDRRVTVEGVVTGVFLGEDRLGGFFLQQQGPTPVGLFVYSPKQSPDAVRPGDRVQVSGRFTTFHGRPQLTRIDGLRVCTHTGLAEPVALRLPQDADRLAELQDVKVRFDQLLTITGNDSLGRYGSLRLSAGGRLFRPGQRPGTDPAGHAGRGIILDDGSYHREPTPIPYLDADGTRRAGDGLQGLTGILTHAFGDHRVHPTRTPEFTRANPRPPPPPRSDGTLRIATLNVENYFLTLGNRGASDRAELKRQRQKLVATLRGIDADLISLSEIENRPDVLDDLVALLNHEAPAASRYRAVAHAHTGTNAIRSALLYRPARVTLQGHDTDRDRIHHRPPLLGWFRPSSGGPTFGVVAVHFKAKVGCPDTGDVDLGQGCWNELRTAQTRRLLEWLSEVRIGDAPILIAGDLNAYAAEDPLKPLRAAGKRDLTTGHTPGSAQYTYVYRGEAGQLDYLLASEPIAQRVVSAGIWHINADEPPFLSYAGRKPASGSWRSSDHDPVWADLRW